MKCLNVWKNINIFYGGQITLWPHLQQNRLPYIRDIFRIHDMFILMFKRRPLWCYYNLSETGICVYIVLWQRNHGNWSLVVVIIVFWLYAQCSYRHKSNVYNSLEIGSRLLVSLLSNCYGAWQSGTLHQNISRTCNTIGHLFYSVIHNYVNWMTDLCDIPKLVVTTSRDLGCTWRPSFIYKETDHFKKPRIIFLDIKDMYLPLYKTADTFF